MKAIIIGGTGATGSALVDQLLEDNEIIEIVSFVRTPSEKPNPKLKEVAIDFDKLDSYSDVINGDIAFSCFGTTLKAAGSKDAQWKVDYEYQYKFASIAKENQVPTFVLLSAQNADANSLIFYSKMKGKLEDAVKDLNFDHLVIGKPSILKRPNSDRLGEKIGVKVVETITELGILKNYQALPVDKVANALIKAGKRAEKKITIIEVKEILELNN